MGNVGRGWGGVDDGEGCWGEEEVEEQVRGKERGEEGMGKREDFGEYGSGEEEEDELVGRRRVGKKESVRKGISEGMVEGKKRKMNWGK